MWHQQRHFGPVVCWLLLAVSGSVQASKVLIWPIDPIIADDQKATSLWIENQGSEPVLMQVRVLGWRQTDGNEGYQQQQDVVISPPIVQVEAGKKQLIRLIKHNQPPAAKEMAYRILVDEIPKPASGTGLHFQMRYSIPLFVYGQGLSERSTAGDRSNQPRLSWQLVKQQGETLLQVTNQGNIHARLSNVSIRQGSKTTKVADGLLGYVLANSTHRWPVEAVAASPIDALVMRVNEDKDPKPYQSEKR